MRAQSRPAPPPPSPLPVKEPPCAPSPSSRGEAPPPPPKPKPVVRPVAANAEAVGDRAQVLQPRAGGGRRFKASQPVILNLQGVEKELSRRLLDFCSGICYALGGHMEKVGARVYLLTPSNVEVSAEERRACRSGASASRDPKSVAEQPVRRLTHHRKSRSPAMMVPLIDPALPAAAVI